MNSPSVFTVTIVDYQVGNIFSIKRACEHVGLNVAISSDRRVVEKSSAVVLPGVGAFGQAIENLKSLDLFSPLQDHIHCGKPVLAICLGMQLLFTESEEFGLCEGLNIIKGSVVKFPAQNSEGRAICIPQIGWNQIFAPSGRDHSRWEGSPLKGIQPGAFMYFVHSYFVVPSEVALVLAETEYEGVRYCSSIFFRNIFACQFHPEKSGREGIKIYQNWASFIREYG